MREKSKTALAVILWLTLLAILCSMGCSLAPKEITQSDLPTEGCVIHRDMDKTTYERVMIVELHKVDDSDEPLLGVTYPDSKSQSVYFKKRKEVSYQPCPTHLP